MTRPYPRRVANEIFQTSSKIFSQNLDFGKVS
jgi:hypothetical protein